MGTHGTFTPPGLASCVVPAEGAITDQSRLRLRASQTLLRLMVAYWIQWLYLARRMVLMCRSACQVPLADPAEGGLVVIGAVVFS